MIIKIFFYISLVIFAISAFVLIVLAIKETIQSQPQKLLTKDDLYDGVENHEDFIKCRSKEQDLHDSMVRSSVRIHYSLYLLEDEFQEYKKNVLSVKLPQKNES